MAAEIKTVVNQNSAVVRKPQLLSKIEGHHDDVNMAIFATSDEGVISISDDRTLRIWLKRDSGHYWPSVCHCLPAPGSSLNFNKSTKRLFVGLGNGTIMEFVVSDDFNRLTTKRDYLAHQDRVTAVLFSLSQEWVLSCAKDKCFQWHCAETGRRLGGYLINSVANCLEFDSQSQYAFVGDSSGQITMLKVSNTASELVTVLKGHSGSVFSLAWDVEQSLLFSASADHAIIVWDIGGQKGSAFDLSGHHDQVCSLLYVQTSKQLLSGGDDFSLILWNMDVRRQETPEWIESDCCQKCGNPFFWNVRTMWENKVIGVRQHHCRKCGIAVCAKCSQNRSLLPILGYEYEVRVCDRCHEEISPDEQAPMATIHDMRHKIICMDVDEQRKLLLTVGKDHLIKIWDVSTVLH